MTQGFFDESEIYAKVPKPMHFRPSIRKLALWFALGVALTLGFIWPVAAQDKLRVGQVATGYFALCDTREDADQLLTIVSEKGPQAGGEWMQEATNTCELGQFAVKVGETVGATKDDPSGRTWTVLNVSSPDDTLHNYVVAPVSILQLTSA